MYLLYFYTLYLNLFLSLIIYVIRKIIYFKIRTIMMMIIIMILNRFFLLFQLKLTIELIYNPRISIIKNIKTHLFFICKIISQTEREPNYFFVLFVP
jgi:hypothetical protein